MSTSKDEEHALIGRQIEEFERFNAMFGAFMLVFARVESGVYRVLLRYAKVSDAVGKSIFSGARGHTMVTYILALLDNTRVTEDQAQHLRFALQQFSTLNNARNDIVHYATTTFNSAGVIVSTVARAKNINAAVTFRVSSADIQAMLADLTDIELHLSLHQPNRRFVNPPANWPSTWRYKSRQPSSSQQKSRVAARKPPIQRPSSPR